VDAVNDLLVPVSIGELVDKVTILELKRDRIADAAKRANVLAELAALEAILAPILAAAPDGTAALVERLRAVNATLWDVEDDLRDCERQAAFGPRFVELARAVYVTNDERARVKREINVQLGSRLVEEKSYAEYG
jgi:hypothetical protein